MIDLGDWNEKLAPVFHDERYLKIRQFLIEEYRNYVVYPICKIYTTAFVSRNLAI